MLEKKAMEVVRSVKPNIISWISAVIGAALVWWTGLPPLGQALLIVQGADLLTGLLVGVCVSVGGALGMESVCGAAMTYMIATEMVSLVENLEIFGLNVPLLEKLLDVAQGREER